MNSGITYRRGKVEDLERLRLANDLQISRKSIEFNVVGVGHEFWMAVEANEVIALAVVARPDAKLRRILYLHVSKSQKSRGIGSDLIKSILEHSPESEFAVTASDGTEGFYQRLGFVETPVRWEMRRPPNALAHRATE